VALPRASSPTLPYLASDAERRALLAVLELLDAAGSDAWDVRDLRLWIEQRVIAAGGMPRLASVREPPLGPIALRPSGSASSFEGADLPRTLAMARARVLAALLDLVDTPSDDHFLRAAIFTGRVRREGGRWVARPEVDAPLSTIALSLMAVAILSNRAFYDRALCVCETCGHVFFDPVAPSRRRCPAHVRDGHASGITRRGGPRRMASGSEE
jgi:hypothetical protein